MIIEGLLNLLFGLINFCFSWLNLPAFPPELAESIDNFLDLIFNNLSLLGFFIRPTTLQIIIPALIIVINFDRIYKFVMWILRKIPILNIN